MKSKLITARSHFTMETLDKPGKCSGCSGALRVGDRAYVKRYKSRANRNQVCRNLLCNLQECWMDWDAGIYTGTEAGSDVYESTNY